MEIKLEDKIKENELEIKKGLELQSRIETLESEKLVIDEKIDSLEKALGRRRFLKC